MAASHLVQPGLLRLGRSLDLRISAARNFERTVEAVSPKMSPGDLIDQLRGGAHATARLAVARNPRRP